MEEAEQYNPLEEAEKLLKLHKSVLLEFATSKEQARKSRYERLILEKKLKRQAKEATALHRNRVMGRVDLAPYTKDELELIDETENKYTQGSGISPTPITPTASGTIPSLSSTAQETSQVDPQSSSISSPMTPAVIPYTWPPQMPHIPHPNSGTLPGAASAMPPVMQWVNGTNNNTQVPVMTQQMMNMAYMYQGIPNGMPSPPPGMFYPPALQYPVGMAQQQNKSKKKKNKNRVHGIPKLDY